ncbi:TetR/AcrR family transcriptional regulator [Sediminibacillus halophilus]|uniref:DNA-binding transcriptional regulator, AcrR family n=1 Tax=Sediminibacillus halophilus TaxID=482461 RepID=A0A1G9P4U8_9BACI|nr:TetR/AcrR family transcriptional regulator [Sediminibacillus halophilus]SDL93750.1 DNA-binding transcriptional regulator, AcrR family [Sediminibacillus halophilus]
MPLSGNQIEKMKVKRDKILEQAIILFSEHGYNDTTISKVAKASGISFGSVFTYFENKEELFHHAVVERLKELSPLLLDFDPNAEDPYKELEAMIDKHIRLFASVGTYLRLVTQVIGQHQRFERQFKELDRFYYTFRYKIADLVAKGQSSGQLRSEVDPLTSSIAYTSFLMGIRLNLADQPEHDIWSDFAPVAIRLFGPNLP